MIYLSLFLNFALIGALTIGGGYASLPLVLELCVRQNGWLTVAEYSDLITLSEITPGPIAINAATFVGTKTGGVPGAVAATLGFVFVPFAAVSVFYLVYKKYRAVPLMRGVLSGLRPAACALITAAGLSVLLPALLGEAGSFIWYESLVPAALALLSFAALRLKKLDPILLILCCGVTGALIEGLRSLV